MGEVRVNIGKKKFWHQQYFIQSIINAFLINCIEYSWEQTFWIIQLLILPSGFIFYLSMHQSLEMYDLGVTCTLQNVFTSNYYK